MNRLIIAYTPYHVLLATAMAGVAEGRNHLVIINDFGSANHLGAALAGGERRLYESVTLMGGSFGVTSRARRQSKYRAALPAMCARTRELRPAEIWVGNDARPESQAAFLTAGEKNGSAMGVYVEDGLTAYAAGVRRDLRVWEKAVGRVVFGRFWSGRSVLGTSRWIEKGLFIYPDLVRTELSRLVKVRIPPETLLTEGIRALAREIVGAAGADPELVRRLSAVVTVGHSDTVGASRRYREAIASLVGQLLEKGCTVGVKYHPRQAERDYLHVGSRAEVTILPHGVPLEYLYVLGTTPSGRGESRSSLRFVVGDISTTLLTARWLVPESCCISLGRALGLLDESVEALFRTVGVRMPTNLESPW